MIVGPLDPHETLRDIEWSTLFFFVGLFMLIEAVIHVGIVGGIADALAEAAGGQAGCGDDGDPLVLGAGLSDRRQHPVHRDGHPDRRTAHRERPRRGCPVVVPGAWAPASAAT